MGRAALKEARKLGRPAARAIVDYFESRIASADNPRQYGKALAGPLQGLWRYRIGDYRAVCKIEDERITILILRVAHRREVYR